MLKKYYKFNIELGDRSGDGHGKCEITTIACNYPLKEFEKAYRETCERTDIAFHSEYGKRYKYEIACDYEDSTIKSPLIEIFAELGIDVWEGFDKSHFDEDDPVYIDGPEHFIELLMEFVQLTLPDLEYEFIYDVPKLDFRMGYGLFY